MYAQALNVNHPMKLKTLKTFKDFSKKFKNKKLTRLLRRDNKLSPV